MGVALRDILLEYKAPVSWDGLSGVAAIDASNMMSPPLPVKYKMRSIYIKRYAEEEVNRGILFDEDDGE